MNRQKDVWVAFINLKKNNANKIDVREICNWVTKKEAEAEGEREGGGEKEKGAL